MPYTLIPEEPSAPAAPARFTVVDEPPPAPQGEAMGAIEAGLVGAGDTLTFGYPGAVAEFLRGPEGRAEVEARVAKAHKDQPTAFDVGGYLTYAIPGGGAVKGAGALAKGLRAAGPKIAETGLRAGGFATRWGGGLAALSHGNLPAAYVSWEAGKKAKALADVLKASRTGAAETAAAERAGAAMLRRAQGGGGRRADPTGPSPGTGALSAEMKAALKRGKFRHQYRTGL